MNMTQTEVPVHRLGWSNPVGDPATGRVYVLGAQCNLICFEGETGKIAWQRQMTEEFGMISTFGGRTPSPAIDEDQVFIAGVAFGWGDNARSGYRVFAFDKKQRRAELDERAPAACRSIRRTRRRSSPSSKGRSSSSSARATAACTASSRARARSCGATRSPSAASTPRRSSTARRVYVCTGEVNIDNSFSGTVRCIDVAGGKPKELWRQDGIEAGFASPTIADGVFYVIDNKGKVHALDAMTGKPQWKRPYSAGTIGKASLVYGDGKLYVCEANGRVSILKIEKGQEKPEVLSREEISGNAQESGREYMIFGSVAIANGRVYLMSAEQMYCIGPKDAKANDGPLPEMAKESDGGDRAPAQVLVTPADVVLQPGREEAVRGEAVRRDGPAGA